MTRALTCKLFGLVLFAIASIAHGQALTKSAINVDAGNTKTVGQTFGYRLTYNCSSTSGPCLNAQVVDLLPAEVQYISTVPASPTGDVAAINVTPNFGGSGRTRVQFVMNSPLPAGNSGDLLINVRFPAGTTPDGTIATNTADGINLGATPGTITTPPVVVTAKATSGATLSKVLNTAPANLDIPESYRLRINNSGTLNYTAIGPVTDTLPAGVVFNGSTPAADCQPGCVGTTPATLTWTSPCTLPLAAGANCDITVNVTYPSATFPSGTSVTNSFTADGTPLGQPAVNLGVGTITHTVTTFVPAPGASFTKNMAGGTPNPPTLNQTFSYDMNIGNNGNVPLDTMVIVDTLPVQFQLASVTTGAYNGFGDFAAGVGVRVSYEKNTALGVFTLWGSSPNSTTNTTLTAPPPGLGAGEFVTKVRWEYGQAAAGASSSTRPLVTGKIVNPDNAGGPVAFGNSIQNCSALTAVFTAGPTNVNRNDCETFNLSGPFVQLNPLKENLSGAGPFNPGQTVSWRLRVRSATQSSDPGPLEGILAADLLPVDLAFVNWTFDDQSTGLPAPQQFQQIPNFNGTGRTLLRWNWNAGSGSLGVNQQVWILVSTTIRNGAATGALSNVFDLNIQSPGLAQRCSGSSTPDSQDFDADGNTAETLCTSTGTINVAPIAQLISNKQIQGVCDAAPTSTSAGTLPGAQLRYQLKVQNVGTVPMQNVQIVDILPFVGDTGVRDTSPRGSQWTPRLAAPIVPPAGTTLYYSTSGNPCRGEVGGPTTGCDPPNWTTVPPAPLTSVKSFKVDFGSRTIDAFDVLSFSFPMVAPAVVPPGTSAFNSFAYQADRGDGIGSLAAEPQKVGIQTGTCAAAALGDFVWVDTNGDGIQNDGPTGLDDVPLTLYDAGADNIPGTPDDVPIMHSVTQTDLGGAPGWYTFAGLVPGTYRVCAALPANYLVTLQNAGGDDTKDSDANPVTKCSAPTTLAANQFDPTLDFGLVPTAALGNYVWFDRNSDGIQNEGPDQGANGVTVNLYADNGDGNADVSTDALVATTVTAPDGFGNPGYYKFQELVPGQPYFVQFVLPSSATGFTTPNATDDANDSDPTGANHLTPIVVLAPDEFNPTLDAGLVIAGGTLALGDQVWLDTNNNGIYEPQSGETGIDNVHLSLYRDANANGLPDADEYSGSTVTATTSGFAGRYRFNNLAAGNYIVVVDNANFTGGGALAGMISSTGNDPAPDPDDDVNGDDNGGNVGAVIAAKAITLVTNGEPTSEDGDNKTNLTDDFGFFPTVTPPLFFDYGDAPDAGSGNGAQNYNTTALHNGASHLLGGQNSPYLGNCVDADDGTAQNVDANADDANGSAFKVGSCGANGDEDGVSFTGPFVPGSTATFTVTSGGPAACLLDAWVDWNGNGVFTDAGEQIASNLAVGGSTNLTPAVPAGAKAGVTYARFRCSSTGGLAPTGPAADGEVEDYAVSIEGRDFGDDPASYGTQGAGAASHLVSGTNPLRLGQCVDLDADGQPSANADGDDNSAGQHFGLCFDDEDGVVFTSVIAACQSTGIGVTASAAGKLDAWVDFNGDGDFNDAGEQIFTSQALTPGSNALSFNAPCTSTPGVKYSRFRLSTAGGLGPTGQAADGEVEDYAVTGFASDFGDAPAPYPTLLADNGALHRMITGYSLGATEDTEENGQPSVNADGDGADEDGVTFPTGNVLNTCATENLTVNLTNTAGINGAKLDAWIDFNGDGDWSDANERIASGVSLASGANSLTVNVPCGAKMGVTYARFRLSSAGVADPTGPALDGEVEDYKVTLHGLDFGDAPDPTYPTLLASNGARHRVDPATSLYLGACVDVEADGQPSLMANGDDIAPGLASAGTCAGGGDEDGVVFLTPPAACHSSSVQITAGAAGVVSAWIDFNGDGDFNDAGEQILTDASVVAGAQSKTIAVPCDAIAGPTYSRFRLSTQTGLTPSGEASDGEVEDYRVVVQGVDYGDAPDTYGTSIATNGPTHVVEPSTSLYLGQCVDTEVDGQPSSNANGDDGNAGVSHAGTCAGVGDEDGVLFTTPITACNAASVSVTAGAAGKLDAWIDYNNDGDFNDAGEQVFSSQNLVAGTNALTFTVPCSSVAGNLYSRFRFSSAGGLTPTGPASDGEVEDHLILGAQEADFGDAPDTYHTTFAAGGPRHAVKSTSTLFLGTCVDGEMDASNPLNGLGDDSVSGGVVAGTCVGNDDEDGVGFPTPLAACTTASVAVTASQAGKLDAWIDFNANGVFDEPAERIATSQNIAAGANTLNVAVPCGAVPGPSYSRFRLSSGGSLGIGGPAIDGEVEDHRVTLTATDWGDAPDSYGTTNAANGPRHAVITGFSLGATEDGEIDGQPNAAASGDGADEDGVAFTDGTQFIACGTQHLSVSLTNTAAIGTPKLDAWIDFDGDGHFDDPRDRIANGQALVNGANDVSVTVPCDVAGHTTTYARFRLSSTGVASSGGGVLDGEVEDYLVSTVGQDYGDAPDSYGTLLAANGARHRVLGSNNPTLGTIVDTESNGQPSVGADGDDTHGDDEDGAVFDSGLIDGAPGHVTLTAGSTGGKVDAWVDFNKNGTFDDPAERIANDLVLNAGQSTLVTFNVPLDAVVGTTYARVRISSAGGLSPTGAAPDGEVEDYAVPVRLGTPSIGIAKRAVAVTSISSEVHRVTYELLVQNTGNVALDNVQVTDDLAATFAGALNHTVISVTSATFTVNPAYDGSATSPLLVAPGAHLDIGGSGKLQIVVEIKTGGFNGPFSNTAKVTGESPEQTTVTDISQDGTSVDPNGDGDPTNDSVPTIVSFGPPASIPSLDIWSMAMLIGLLAGLGLRRQVRRK
jgi:uncharacterized repeat protein (TIGR01451 family)